jgi:hypothetical protein
MRFAAPACLTNLPSPATCNYLFKCPLRVIHDRDEPAAGRAPFRYAPKATENHLRAACRDGPIADVSQS